MSDNMNRYLRIFIVQFLLAFVMFFGEMKINFPKLIIFIVVSLLIEYMYAKKALKEVEE